MVVSKSSEQVQQEKAETQPKTEAKTGEEQVVPTGRMQKAMPADAIAKEEAGAEVQRQIQEKIEQENAQGFRGVPADPTPNENYTVAGVTDPNKHVPEEFKIQTGTVVLPDVHPDAKK